MDRVPLVSLPASSDRPTPARRRPLPARHRRRRDEDARRRARPRAGQAPHSATAGPSNEDAVGAKAAVQALLDAAGEALDGAGIGERELAAAVAAIAGTDTASVARHVHAARGESWIVVNDVVGAWATRDRRRRRASRRSPAPARTCSASAPAGAAGGPAAGAICSATRAPGYWLGVESIRAALRDRDASGPATGLGDAACEFFALRDDRGASRTSSTRSR